MKLLSSEAKTGICPFEQEKPNYYLHESLNADPIKASLKRSGGKGHMMLCAGSNREGPQNYPYLYPFLASPATRITSPSSNEASEPPNTSSANAKVQRLKSPLGIFPPNLNLSGSCSLTTGGKRVLYLETWSITISPLAKEVKEPSLNGVTVHPNGSFEVLVFPLTEWTS